MNDVVFGGRRVGKTNSLRDAARLHMKDEMAARALSAESLATLAKVSSRKLRAFLNDEQGSHSGNVTLDWLNKVLAVLPHVPKQKADE